MDKTKRIKQLTKLLNEYRDAYYNQGESIISDYDYDNLFDELQKLEEETEIILSNSPTQTVGYEVKSQLEKVKHSHSMLSLGKTKSVNDLIKFSNGKDCIISLKMDGLTVLNTYENGKLIQSETRGDGEEGELITHNAKVFDNLPLQINNAHRFEIEGEAIITKNDFELINSKLSEENKYKNPRNLASGSVRQLDNKIAKERHVKFVAWKIPFGFTHFTEGFNFAQSIGFEVVPYVTYNSKTDDIDKKVEELKSIAKEKSYPIDGLVITYDNVEYGKSLGFTGHHPKHSLAFKFYDEEKSTTLKNIEWTMGKSGTLTPVAVFNDVEIDGTIINRASLHNLSILTNILGTPWVGQKINVFKSNMIIPQISWAEKLSGDFDKDIEKSYIPTPLKCPYCGELVGFKKENDTEEMICTNPNCKGKILGKLCHAVSKKALNIDGLSEATLQKFIDRGWLQCVEDIYHLPLYRDKISRMEGFGTKSTKKLMENIEKSKDITLDKFISALSIPLIGTTVSKDIAKFCNYDIEKFKLIMGKSPYKFTKIEGFGDKMAHSLFDWWSDNVKEFLELERYFRFKKIENNINVDKLKGQNFVITGKLHHFANRDALKEKIESLGGKVVGSISSNTSFLINNNVNSTSSKNTKAKKLNIPIISEDDFVKMIRE